MPNNTKIIFFDYDGTLVDQDEGISSITPQTLEALYTLKANGNITMLATGRSRFFVPQDILSVFSGCISCNGAAASINKETLYIDNIAPFPCTEIIDFAVSHSIGCCFENDICGSYLEKTQIEFLNGMRYLNIDTSAFSPLGGNYADLTPCKCMMFFGDEASLCDFQKQFSSRFELRIGKGGRYIDFNALGVNKGYGVKRILSLLNIPPENAVAFGDGENDAEMLKSCGVGVAMKKHHPLLDGADMITDSVKNNGVCRALEKLKLI